MEKTEFKNWKKVVIVETTDGRAGEIGVYTAIGKKYVKQGYINVKTAKTFIDRQKKKKNNELD
ncbi:MAG: hypothetical protein ACOC2M_05035 [bacterium]